MTSTLALLLKKEEGALVATSARDFDGDLVVMSGLRRGYLGKDELRDAASDLQPSVALAKRGRNRS